jgi:adenylate cyclase
VKRYSSSSAKWQAILSLSEELLELPSLDAVIQALQDFAGQFLKCNAAVRLADPVFAASNGVPQAETVSPAPLAPISPVLVDTDLIQNDSKIVSRPLIIHNSVLGEIRCYRDVDEFNKNDIALLEALAAQASIVIEIFRLSQDSERQAARLSTVSEISNAIASILDLDLLLNSITSLIHKYFEYPYVYVFTTHMWRKKIQLRAAYTGDSSIDTENIFYDLDSSNDQLNQVVESHRAVLSDGSSADLILSSLPPTNSNSELIVPLIFGDQALGIVWLRSEQEQAFNQSDVLLFETLGDNIAVALRNANLYQSEQWRRQVAESMRDVAFCRCRS